MSAAVEITEPRQYRDYSPEFKAEALAHVAANNGNVWRTANELGIPEPTLRDWTAQASRYRALQEQKQLDLAQKHENNLHRLADSVTDTDLQTVPFIQKVTAIGILTDKMQLLRNQPTSITEHLNSDNLTIVLQSVLNEINPTESTD